MNAKARHERFTSLLQDAKSAGMATELACDFAQRQLAVERFANAHWRELAVKQGDRLGVFAASVEMFDKHANDAFEFIKLSVVKTKPHWRDAQRMIRPGRVVVGIKILEGLVHLTSTNVKLRLLACAAMKNIDTLRGKRGGIYSTRVEHLSLDSKRPCAFHPLGSDLIEIMTSNREVPKEVRESWAQLRDCSRIPDGMFTVCALNEATVVTHTAVLFAPRGSGRKKKKRDPCANGSEESKEQNDDVESAAKILLSMDE